MNSQNTQTTGVSRRSIARGAAWSVPTIALASVAPATAASVCEPTKVTESAKPASTTSAAAGESTFVLPSNVTSINFDIAGGGGGAYSPAANYHGGSGVRLIGTLDVPAGATIRIVAGQGGTGPAGWGADTATGGQGFGNGANSGTVPSNSNDTLTGGSGGGGSAILVNGTAMVIAGGGGGAAGQGSYTITGSGSHATFSGSNGGDATFPGASTATATSRHNVTVTGASPMRSQWINGSGNAYGATPGESGVASVAASTNPITNENNWYGYYKAAAGSAGNLTTGGNGGVGALNRRIAGSTGKSMLLGGSGGGGGYAGGAGGTVWCQIYWQAGGSRLAYMFSGSAGGGSSYLNDAAQATPSLAGNGSATQGRRNPGFATVTYDTVCP
ncbi:hypothetical protein [Demetria terragena]|uniref:hypothetical protein n=1 Tax=Demetria terragena TaxID=63959 RepID=UPI0003A94000|nr:hypothetical protein [Demetria terragena]